MAETAIPLLAGIAAGAVLTRPDLMCWVLLPVLAAFVVMVTSRPGGVDAVPDVSFRTVPRMAWALLLGLLASFIIGQ